MDRLLLAYPQLRRHRRHLMPRSVCRRLANPGLDTPELKRLHVKWVLDRVEQDTPVYRDLHAFMMGCSLSELRRACPFIGPWPHAGGLGAH